MSYNYFLKTDVQINQENLTKLKYYLDVTRADQVVSKLSEQDVLAEVEWVEVSGRYVESVAVLSLPKVPEYLGIKGVENAFKEFLKFVDYNVPHGGYVLEDEQGNTVTVEVK